MATCLKSRQIVFYLRFTIVLIVTLLFIDVRYLYPNLKGTYNDVEVLGTALDMDFGIVLFAYSTREELVRSFLTETNSLCKRLLSTNSNRLKVSLFTIQTFYEAWLRHYSSVVEMCEFDQIIFVDHINALNVSINDNSLLTDPRQGREWSTRILSLLHTPYYVTLTLDSDMFPCDNLHVDELYKAFMNNHIDFAYTSFKRNSVPQAGLLLFNYGSAGDQLSLYKTIKRVKHVVNIFLLNNRYNVRMHLHDVSFQNQMLYPKNKVIIYHHRQLSQNCNQTNVCEELNKYNDKLRMGFTYRFNHHSCSVSRCFGENDDALGLAQCSQFPKFMQMKPGSMISRDYTFVWSKQYKCQWNNTVYFVPLAKDTCNIHDD
eukprot:182185_1